MTSQWQLQPIFGNWMIAAALVAVLLLLLLVKPTFGHLSKSRQRWLNILRGLIAFMLLLAMLRPTYIRTEKQAQTAEVLLLFDTSRSMTHRDGEDGSTRWQQQLALLQQAIPKLNQLGENFRVELLGFSNELHPQVKTNNKLTVSAKPVGEETDLGQALNDAIQRHAGKRIAAVILMSDGAQRAVTPKIPPQQAARQLDRLATPLYTIAHGQSRDQSQSRDVAIENLQDEYSVFVKNEFALRVGVRVQGYVNQPIPVWVVFESSDGTTKKIGPQEIVATQDSQTVMADFSFRPERAGEFKIRVQAEGQPGEIIDNNEQTAFLNVREGGLRVLLLSSAVLGSEQKFIRWSLDESEDIQLDVHLAKVWQRASWPTDLESKVRLEDYDVFVVGDVDANAFRPGNWSKMAQLVGESRGLMMYGGPHSFGPGGYADNALAAVLPIRMQGFEREPDPAKFTRNDRHLEGDQVMLPTTDSSVTFLAPDEQNLVEWKKLKPLRGANKFDKLKTNGVKELAATANGDPLLVEGGYLRGRVLALATDSTNRWYKFGQAEAHKKFWRQSVLWLARRDKQQANSVFIKLPQRRIDAKRKLVFQTGLTDEVGDVIVDAKLRATLTKPDSKAKTIQLAQSDDEDVGGIANAMTGLISETEEPGDYRIAVEAVDGDQVIASAAKEFVVEKKDFELGDPAANPGLLEMLSRITERAGGKSIAPEQLSRLLDDIKASPPKSEIETQKKWQLGDTTADAWGYFAVLVLLLTLEWFFRKKWGLV